MTTCICATPKPIGDNDHMDFCALNGKLCLLESGDPCGTQEQEEEEA